MPKLPVVALCFLVVAEAVVAKAVATEAVRQTTEGWCSPAVAEVGGDVTVACHGVDPEALERLKELLRH
jgi:hypothetical protein